jgi:hypothetical protein
MPTPGPNDRQLPIGDEIFLDHVGHFVRDIEAASRAFRRAGFAPTPVSIQSNPDPAGGPPKLTGTGNVTVMLQRGYIEALFKTSDTPLGRQLDAGLARHSGVHLIAFSVADAASAHRRLAGQGFRVQPLVEMQRPVDTGGAPGTAAFTLARLEPGEMPEGRIQILTHHTEQMVWQPRWLEHPNGAFGLAHVAIAVDYAPDAARRFARFTGRTASPTTYGQVIRLDRGGIALVNPKSFALMYPDIDAPSLQFIGVYGIKVKSLDVVEDFMQCAKLRTRRTDDVLYAVWPEELGQGLWVFAD